MAKKNKKQNRPKGRDMKAPEFIYEVPASPAIAISSSEDSQRHIQVFMDVNGWLEAKIAENQRIKIHSAYVQVFANVPEDIATLRFSVIYAQTGAVFTPGDYSVTTDQQTALMGMSDKSFSYEVLGTYYTNNLIEIEAVMTCYKNFRVNLTKVFKTMASKYAKNLESGVSIPHCAIIVEGIKETTGTISLIQSIHISYDIEENTPI